VLFTFLFFGDLNIYAQDTIFSKIEKNKHVFFKKDTHHIYALFQKNRDEKIDTIFRYDYGVYMNVKVKDASVHENVFMCVYRSMDGIFFTNYSYENGKWSPLLGGYLFFLAPREKDDYQVSIKSKERVEVRQGDKGKKTYTFMIIIKKQLV
jgi:hypothetical protein